MAATATSVFLCIPSFIGVDPEAIPAATLALTPTTFAVLATPVTTDAPVELAVTPPVATTVSVAAATATVFTSPAVRSVPTLTDSVNKIGIVLFAPAIFNVLSLTVKAHVEAVPLLHETGVSIDLVVNEGVSCKVVVLPTPLICVVAKCIVFTLETTFCVSLVTKLAVTAAAFGISTVASVPVEFSIISNSGWAEIFTPVNADAVPLAPTATFPTVALIYLVFGVTAIVGVVAVKVVSAPRTLSLV